MVLYNVTYSNCFGGEVYTETRTFANQADAKARFRLYIEDVFDDYKDELRVSSVKEMCDKYLRGTEFNIKPDIHDVCINVKMSEQILHQPSGKYRCAHCGSDNIAVKAWVDPNTGHVDVVETDVICRECNDYTKPTEPIDEQEILAMLGLI